jgi:hypothetical protein
MQEYSRSISLIQQDDESNIEQVNIELNKDGELSLERLSFTDRETLGFFAFNKEECRLIYEFLDSNFEIIFRS